ncbi:hypothetical protein BV898_02215 [Hypsibius exemplaris]|uniref:Protein phosphatase 1 regulatory subunit 21 N-terminal domain-containing protein n=1 Tax=Hypsibius exemplaris TaxID=2072580 RepID=A0A1W0X8J7_HYPEX|nr:hypothetical protein BV898_02215 [Hypsibius exemplaris]
MDNEDTKSTGSSSESLEQKHNRLLTEFAKVRSQLTVLKSVVVEEKKSGTELKDKMRQKDQVIRRLEQETESLRFCNGQIQSRLVVLQSDLKERDAKPQKNSRKKEAAPPPSSVEPSSYAQELNADFVQLVEINAHLSSKLSSVQSEFESSVTSLEARLHASEASAKKAAAELLDYRNMYESLERRIKLETDISTQREMAELKSRLQDLTKENDDLRQERSRARVEIDGLNQTKMNSVQQAEIVRQLTQQIDSQKEQLLRLQHEKEKFMMEAQMLKFRKDNVGSGDLTASDSSVNLAEESASLAEHSSTQTRLKSRVTTLISDLQYADGKAFYYQAECSALHLRLQLAEEDKDQTKLHLSDAQHHIDDLKKQLETTVLQTNEQMGLLSEHVATMNEKLQDKTDEINNLKFELQQVQLQPPSMKVKPSKPSR